MNLVNAARVRRGQPAFCALCGEQRHNGPPKSPAVATVGGHALCERHVALTRAIQADAESHEVQHRRPQTRRRRSGAL